MEANTGQPPSDQRTQKPGDAEFALGVGFHQNGQLERAAGAYSQAIAVNKGHCQAIHNLGAIMQVMGEVDRALGLFQRATELDPAYAEAFSNWAIALKQAGQTDKAIEKAKHALSLKEGQAQMHAFLADEYRAQEAYEDAIVCYQRAVELNPQSLDFQNNLGVCYRKLGQNQEALACFDKAIAIKPDFVDSLVNSANALSKLDMDDLAIERLNKALQINPDLGATHNNLGIVLAKAGRFEEALACYEKAIELNADKSEVMNNLANALNSSGRTDDAVDTFKELISEDAGHYVAYNNLGSAYKDMARYDEAEKNFRKSIEIEPSYAEGHANLGYTLLMRGAFEEGWAEYGWRGMSKGSILARRTYDQPAWEGQNVTGKRVYVYPEQGLGDIVQFSRYVPLLKSRGAKVIMELPPFLMDLFKGFKGADEFNLQGNSPPDFDIHVSIMDLPQYFGTTLETIPAPTGYLKADDALITLWEERLRDADGYRVGFVWAGNPKHGNDKNRSVQLEQMRPLIELQGVTPVSLQVGKDDQAKALFGDKIIDIAPDLSNFAETAAAMSNLDLIVSVDSSPLHVAGALGLPVWGLIPFIPDWRWLLERDDSPWYPTMKLFRQDDRKSWEPVIDRVCDAIKQDMS